LEGLAKVAAVNCDDDANKPFCGRMGVQGFPTLKFVIPGKKPGQPRIEDYRGERSAKAIVDAVVDRIPNHIKKLTDKNFQEWLKDNHENPKAILFTEKGTTSALLKALAIDFLGAIQVGQVRNKETEVVAKFDISSFPTLVLLPGGDTGSIVYEGELKKKPMVEFLSQIVSPNPDPAPSLKKSDKKASKTKSSASTATEESAPPAETPEPIVVVDEAENPVKVSTKVVELDRLTTLEDLESKCLTTKSGTCVLVLLPESDASDGDLPAPAKKALASSGELAQKLLSHHLPFYGIPNTNEGSKSLRSQLGLLEEKATEIIAINGRRGWWRHYEPAEKDDFSQDKIEEWIDSIRLGEGAKKKLPEGVVIEEKQESAPEHDEL